MIKEKSLTYTQIISKAKKLKELAERGERGEKDSAKVFYESFMKKHGISEEDISPKHYLRQIRLKNKDWEVLLSHVILAVNPFVKIDKKKGYYEVVLDDEDFIEVMERTNFFYAHFRKETDLFFRAFMEKFSSNFLPDEQAVAKHSEKSKKMQADAEELYKKNNPESDTKKTESEPQDRISDDVLNSKAQEVSVLSERASKKFEFYKKAIDFVKYTKANRRLEKK